ncbi:MAG: NAD-dependent protein deacylase [Candidatus Heimdallarchaeota archaeon]|nr:NAD-dependent protein deacylase [Candidatus Heimdallarchaeota archaeon]
MSNKIKQAISLVQAVAQKGVVKLYVLTGAGVSKASKIPTFRGENGLWTKYNINEVGTREAWLRNPKKVWKLYAEGIYLLLNANPNPAHKAIARLEQKGICQAVITQNVDSLHQKAGSENVLEIHGNLLRIRCNNCSKKQMFSSPPTEIPPKCECGGLLRPDAVLFNELLPQKLIQQSFEIAKKANIALVIGTSATVYPAAQLPFLSKKSGAKIIVFNPEKTDHVRIADIFVQGKCEETLPIFVDRLIETSDFV